MMAEARATVAPAKAGDRFTSPPNALTVDLAKRDAEAANVESAKSRQSDFDYRCCLAATDQPAASAASMERSMFSNFNSVKFSRDVAASTLLALAACGGGVGENDTAASPPSPPPNQPTLELAANYTDIIEGSVVGNVYPNWKNGSGTGAAIDGVNCITTEQYHVHMVISIYWNGVRQALPSGLGLTGCSYELHTHDSTGIVHLETDAQRTFTLGQFFSVWGQGVSSTNVAGISGQAWFYTIDNEKVTPFSGDPKTIAFQPHGEIAIVIGSPPAKLDKNRMPVGF